MGATRPSRVIGLLCAIAASLAAGSVFMAGRAVTAPADTPRADGVHEGVVSCEGSTCHSRQVASGVHVRQNELISWNDRSSPAGAHSRAYAVLTGERGQRIARRMGIGPAQNAEQCLGCHTDLAAKRGERFRLADGVGCESCHGGSGGWLASHYAMNGTRAANVAAGMKALDQPKVLANVCLDCHFGGPGRGQFVTHEMMAAGHPRVSFELDLFNKQQQHWDVDADYCGANSRGKTCASGVRVWAVGQALALNRALTLYGTPGKGTNGAFPEFYFFDCHSCHRPISDDAKFRPAKEANPGRPIPTGAPPFNDENMIMLSAAARVAAPGIATRFESQSRAFHAALAKDRGQSVQAAAALAATARQLADAFDRRGFSKAETLSILDAVLSGENARRYTDYTGASQAVMAADTLLNALVSSGQVDRGAAQRVRPALDRAYREVRDPNTFRPEAYRQALAEAAQAARALR